VFFVRQQNDIHIMLDGTVQEAIWKLDYKWNLGQFHWVGDNHAAAFLVTSKSFKQLLTHPPCIGGYKT